MMKVGGLKVFPQEIEETIQGLERLIRIALDENQDRLIALSRIAEARERVTVVRAEQFPFLDGSGSGGSPLGSRR